jgi:hypothetical protein
MVSAAKIIANCLKRIGCVIASHIHRNLLALATSEVFLYLEAVRVDFKIVGDPF